MEGTAGASTLRPDKLGELLEQIRKRTRVSGAERAVAKGVWKEDVGGEGVLSWEWKEVMRLRRLAQPRECNGYSINVPAHAGELEKLTQQDSDSLEDRPRLLTRAEQIPTPPGHRAAAFWAGETLLLPQVPGKPQTMQS